MRTGRSGSPPTGCPRCASRSGCGSTRSSSCRSCEAASSEPVGELRPLDRWLVERTKAFVAEATAAYEATLTVDVIRAFEAFVEDVSNWYIRRSRRRFYSLDEPAFHTLWYALVQ